MKLVKFYLKWNKSLMKSLKRQLSHIKKGKYTSAEKIHLKLLNFITKHTELNNNLYHKRNKLEIKFTNLIFL